MNPLQRAPARTALRSAVKRDPAALLHPASDSKLRWRPVSQAVSASRNNGPELLDVLASGE
jgi:putative SOS response-associated peptidase YedK